MSIQDHIAAFAEGWTTGNLDRIMASLAPQFTLHDPNAGNIAKPDTPEYLDGFKSTVQDLRGEMADSLLMEMSDVVIKDDEIPASVWAWWIVPGTSLSGSALVKVGEDGVVSERIAYHVALGSE